jgi:spoIIIJ-associated protein
MLSKSDIETIKKTTEEFFKKMTFEVDLEFLPEKDQTLPINVKTETPQILIGEGGQTLSEIQYLLKSILKKKVKDLFYIDLDVNDYKKKKTEYLKELARSAADEASLSKKEKRLASMPAYERRIIHMELADRGDVVSESAGEEPERRVIIRPRP